MMNDPMNDKRNDVTERAKSAADRVLGLGEDSYFATCDRDDKGRCVSAGGRADDPAAAGERAAKMDNRRGPDSGSGWKNPEKSGLAGAGQSLDRKIAIHIEKTAKDALAKFPDGAGADILRGIIQKIGTRDDAEASAATRDFLKFLNTSGGASLETRQALAKTAGYSGPLRDDGKYDNGRMWAGARI